jgi:S1-C subfamily serine protease
VTGTDWVALGIVGLAACGGFVRGLAVTALSLGGLLVGAVLGARIAPQFFGGGAASWRTPLAGLVGAAVGAVLFQSIGSLAGGVVRGGLAVVPPLRIVDSVGGGLAGAVWGAAIVWVAGAAVVQLPWFPQVRRDVRRSEVMQRLNEIVPPRTVLRTLARIDPFPAISGPHLPSEPPDPQVLARPGVGRAEASVLRITATACGLGVEGTGWVARPKLVVTAAHVVAGGDDITVGDERAEAWLVDRANDVAILRAESLEAPPLPVAAPEPGTPVAILGYPENGPFDARAGRIGATAGGLVDGHLRTVTALSGLIRHGNSGGPAVDASGAVRTTVFAARRNASGGYGIPTATVEAALGRAHGRVSTGDCS